MAQVRDPDGFARLHQLAEPGRASSRKDAQIAATRIATLVACKGGSIRNITVGDCVELVDTQRQVHARGGQKKVDFYQRLRALGTFPEDAPATIRAFGLALGQLSIEELVDRYRLQCRPVRNLIVDYLRERQASLDFASLDAISRTLAGLFWARIEALAPGTDSRSSLTKLHVSAEFNRFCQELPDLYGGYGLLPETGAMAVVAEAGGSR